MQFEWDARKAAANLRKHGVSFEEAMTVLAPAIFEDLDHSEKEPRYLAIGFSQRGRMLTFAFTPRSQDVGRIISDRRSTRQEQERYAKAKREADDA